MQQSLHDIHDALPVIAVPLALLALGGIDLGYLGKDRPITHLRNVIVRRVWDHNGGFVQHTIEELYCLRYCFVASQQIPARLGIIVPAVAACEQMFPC